MALNRIELGTFWRGKGGRVSELVARGLPQCCSCLVALSFTSCDIHPQGGLPLCAVVLMVTVVCVCVAVMCVLVTSVTVMCVPVKSVSVMCTCKVCDCNVCVYYVFKCSVCGCHVCRCMTMRI